MKNILIFLFTIFFTLLFGITTYVSTVSYFVLFVSVLFSVTIFLKIAIELFEKE